MNNLAEQVDPYFPEELPSKIEYGPPEITEAEFNKKVKEEGLLTFEELIAGGKLQYCSANLRAKMKWALQLKQFEFSVLTGTPPSIGPDGTKRHGTLCSDCRYRYKEADRRGAMVDQLRFLFETNAEMQLEISKAFAGVFGKTRTEEATPAKPVLSEGEIYNEAIAWLKDQSRSGNNVGFINSLRDQVNQGRRLSAKQISGVIDNWKKASGYND